MRVVFLHGKESGPNGSKIQSLRAAGWDVLAPDCEGVESVERRVEIARAAIAGEPEPFVLVGSSMGGLTAALLWSALATEETPPPVAGVLLLVPALNWPEAAGIEHVHERTVVIHGVHDDLVPVDASRAFIAQHGCRYVEVDDGHRLADSHETILAEVAALAGR